MDGWQFPSLGIIVLAGARQSLVTRQTQLIPRDGNFDSHLEPMKDNYIVFVCVNVDRFNVLLLCNMTMYLF